MRHADAKGDDPEEIMDLTVCQLFMRFLRASAYLIQRKDGRFVIPNLEVKLILQWKLQNFYYRPRFRISWNFYVAVTNKLKRIMFGEDLNVEEEKKGLEEVYCNLLNAIPLNGIFFNEFF